MPIIFERLGGWGLANSLFQIATTMAIAHDNNTTYAFPDDCAFKRTRFDTECLFKNPLPWTKPSTDSIYKSGPRWGTGSIIYMKPPQSIADLIIDGFFQSDQYFGHIRDQVVEAFALRPDKAEYLRNKYADILSQPNACTLHVRRTDYFTAQEMRVLDIEYYRRLVSLFGDDTLFVIFSDDIPWCKANFDFIPNKVFIEEGNDFLEMHLMSYFPNHIIANSTFSWWGAWLSDNNNITFMPDPHTNWFSDKYYSENARHSDFSVLVPRFGLGKWTIV